MYHAEDEKNEKYGCNAVEDKFDVRLQTGHQNAETITDRRVLNPKTTMMIITETIPHTCRGRGVILYVA